MPLISEFQTDVSVGVCVGTGVGVGFNVGVEVDSRTPAISAGTSVVVEIRFRSSDPSEFSDLDGSVKPPSAGLFSVGTAMAQLDKKNKISMRIE